MDEEQCFYYGACGNTVDDNSLMCSECLGLARHKDKLGAHVAGNLMEFTSIVYRFYDEPEDVMEALHEKGVEDFVDEIARWSDNVTKRA